MGAKKSTARLSREALLRLFKEQQRPLSRRELQGIFKHQLSAKKDLKNLLREMVREGVLFRLKNNRYGLPGEMNLQNGTLWCTRSGNGFVISDREEEKDIFVPSRSMKSALHGDRVVVRVEHSFRGRKEGKIIKVTERRSSHVVGVLQRQKNFVFLIPEDERVSHHFVVEEGGRRVNWSEGNLVAARITGFPEDIGDPMCKVVKVFKNLDNIETLTQLVQYKHSLPMRFKKSMEVEASRLQLDISAEGRLDLRGLEHVTIDGEFAKDFDDAVCIEKDREGYGLYVSIADVSYYVNRGSNLDKEAYGRGTSIYFPGAVVPMLPKALSNGICSLNPQEDRLALTVKLNYTKRGDLIQASFHRSVIRSAMRLTYNAVEDALIKGDGKMRDQLGKLLRRLEWMGELATILAQGREKRGTLDFDLPEPEVILDLEGGIRDILRRERLFSHRIIEEFMIAANEAVARTLTDKKIPTLYRIHEPPEKEKLGDFERLLHNLPVGFKKDPGGRLPLQLILAKVRDTEYEFLVNRILLRSMKQARYSAVNKGHYGLSSDAYLHFTSPIRRYPDLVCHRILKGLLSGDGNYSEKALEPMAVHLSERERIAMDAEREIEDRIRVLFMKDKVGAVYEGIISHITSFGFFVELLDVFVEGIVLLTELHDDYYMFQEERFRLVGRRTKKVCRIGDKVKIKVVLADVERNQLHFTLLS
jgi:ribonuclease R